MDTSPAVITQPGRRHSHLVASRAPEHPEGAKRDGIRCSLDAAESTPTQASDSGASHAFRWGLRNRLRGPLSNPSASPVSEIEIYYGTMFGSAERYARALALDISSRHDVRVRVYDLDGFNEDTFAGLDRLAPSRVFVFVVSTHFAGAPSPSAERFRDWLNYLAMSSPTNAKHASKCDQTASRKPPTAATSRFSFSQTRALGKMRWLDVFTGLAAPHLFPRRRQPLSGMQFAVFGIGDSVYLTYNAVGKFVDTKLKQLGATRFHALGLGDCSNDVDGPFEAWQAGLRLKLPLRVETQATPSLAPTVAIPTGGSARKLIKKAFSASRLVFPSIEAEGKFEKVDAPNVPDDLPTDDASEGPTNTASKSDYEMCDWYGQLVRLRFGCRVLIDSESASRQLHALGPISSVEHSMRSSDVGHRTPRMALFDDQPFADLVVVKRFGHPDSVSASSSTHRDSNGTNAASRSVTFSVRLLNAAATYATVSTLAIFPQNSPDVVDTVAEAFGYNLDAVIQLYVDKKQQTQLPFPTPCTVRTALTEFLELSSVTREFVRIAAGYVATTDERALLLGLTSTDGSSAFRTQIQDQHKGVLDLIAIAPTLQIPLEVLVNFAPTIRPRYFTIASSPRVTPRDLDLAVLLGRPGQPQGLTVSFFERILAATTDAPVPLRGFISASRFQFPDDGASPMVLIASGVGFSAMRAILAERLALWSQDQGAQSRIPVIPTHLLFLGTANDDSVVFRDDLRRWEQQLVVKVHYAFSNDRRHARRYVQDIVTMRMDEIVQAVRSSNCSRVFVCGRTAMVRRIREIFEADQARRGNAWFDAIHKSGRFTEEGYN